jgi:hypothetical protein
MKNILFGLVKMTLIAAVPLVLAILILKLS